MKRIWQVVIVAIILAPSAFAGPAVWTTQGLSSGGAAPQLLVWSVQRAPEGTNTAALDTGYCIPGYGRPNADEYPQTPFNYKYGIPVHVAGTLKNLRSVCADTVDFQVVGADSFWEVTVIRGGGEIVTGIKTLVVNGPGAGGKTSTDLVNTYVVVPGDFVMLRASTTYHRGPTNMGHTLELVP